MARAYAALATLGVIWGTNFIYVKWSTALISPAQTVFRHLAPVRRKRWVVGACPRTSRRPDPGASCCST